MNAKDLKFVGVTQTHFGLMHTNADDPYSPVYSLPSLSITKPTVKLVIGKLNVMITLLLAEKRICGVGILQQSFACTYSNFQ